MNGDGKTDIIWLNQTSGTVAVWLMNEVTFNILKLFRIIPPTEGEIQIQANNN